jgi:hypothetical protein
MTKPGDTASQTAQWIALLSSPNAGQRAAGAAALYQAAGKLLQSVANTWMKDGDFCALARRSRLPAARESVSAEAFFIAGIAVEPLTFEEICAANGSPRLADVPPDQDAKEFELHLGESDLDILTTRDRSGDGAIARFLKKFGEGIQQIEIYVRDVDRATQILCERFALPPIYPATRPGADGTRVNFFLAPTREGKKVLIELVEDSETSQH